MGVTELGRMLANDPNMAPSVVHGLGRWEAGRSRGGMDPQRTGSVRVGEEGGDTSNSRQSNSSSSSSNRGTSSGERTSPANPPPPPHKAPQKTRKPRPFESIEEDAPHPTAPPPKPKAKAKPKAKSKAKPPPALNPRAAPCRMGAGTPMGMCRVWGTPGVSIGRRGAMGGPSAK